MANNTNPNSIRQICLRGFLAGTPRSEIAKQIQEQAPNSMAAVKAVKHIAWHFGDMKKRGVIPKDLVLPKATAVTSAPAAEGEATA